MKLTGFGAYARPVPTPKMPPGLLELMEGLTKDILKNNPENVYEFCAGHMQKLLEIRNGGGTGTAPKYQLSLDEKIKTAQEKIRQRIYDRQLQNQKEMSNISNELLEDKINVTESKNLTVVENAVDNITTPKQPVYHGDELVKISEVEIFHQPDVIITTTDNNKDDLSLKQEVKECLAISTESVQNSTLITAGDEEVKESSLVTKLEPSNNLDEFKKEAEQSVVVLETDTPAPLEVIQNESPINGVKEELNKKMVGAELLSSNILKNEESRREVEISENVKMNDENTETVSEIKQVTEKSENVSDANPKSISQEADDTNFPTKSEVISMPSDSVPDSEFEENKDDKTIVIDVQEVIKNEQEEKEMNPDQQIIENLNTEKVPLDAGNGETEFCKEIEENLADSELNRNASESIENTTELVGGKNNSSKTIIVESQTEVDQSGNESVLETRLENSATEENQPMDKHPDPTAETIIPAQHVTKNETLAAATHLENQELSNDHVDENVLQNDIDKKSINVTEISAGEKNHITTELYVDENDIHNNATHMKTDMTTENSEPIENREGNAMDLETAAITIQKVFRTFLFSKSRASTLDDTANDNSLDEEIEKKDEPEYIISSANLSKERRALGISRMDTVLQTVNEEKSLSLSTDDSSTLSSAATTIQAHVRGFLVRNRMASYKTASNSSLVNSEEPSTKSLNGDTNEPKKTILNIHIVPERGQFMSRDESMLTSIDLPLDNSPPSSINLHPLGYDKSEPRKQLKREDAIQSVSPPSNNSGKLSEELDYVKDSLELKQAENSTYLLTNTGKQPDIDTESCDTTLTISSTADTVVDAEIYNATEVLSSPEHNSVTDVKNEESTTNFSSDEMDVVTPFPTAIEKPAQENESDEKPKLVHTGEFHDIVLQTQVKRNESSVVREFKNVLVYFLLWDKT